MILVFLGCPGAGKGTQAARLSEHFNIPLLSTGDMLRSAIRDKTAVGLQAKAIIDQGELVPDETIIGIVQERTLQADCQNGFILDGFPRTIEQAQALDGMPFQIDAVINIAVGDAVIIERLSGRRVHPASGRTYHTVYNPPQQADHDDVTGEPLIQRDDDQPETIRHRLSVYHEKTEPLVAYFENLAQQQNQLTYHAVDGEQSIDQIYTEILQSLA